MNKSLKVLASILLVVGVLLLAFLSTGKKQVKIISNSDLDKVTAKEGYVYYGELSNEDELKDFAKEADLRVNLLDSSKNENKNLKEGTLYKYKNGEIVYSYSGDLNSYKAKSSLMKEGILEKSFITITVDEYKEIIKNPGYNFMFIGSATCGWCDRFKVSINETLKKYDYNIYYIDLSTLTQEGYSDLVATDNYMTENGWGTPLNLLYKDGKRINVLSGYVPADELIKFLKENKVI